MKTPTRAIHAGTVGNISGKPVLSPLEPATSFYVHPDDIGFSANDLKEDPPMFYARWANPTADTLEKRLAALEDGEAALSFASGMAAISGLLLSKLRAGDHLVLSDVCYAGVAEFAHDILPRYGIAVTAVDTSDIDAVAQALRPETRLVHIETPANPILRLSDIGVIAEIAHASGAELSVDSTLATPIATQPLTLGADYVVHSLTKYLCGHGDALGGAVVGRKAAIDELRKFAGIHLGGIISPFAAWLILRGIETLPARMAIHHANTEKVVDFLSHHPNVTRAWWPGSQDGSQYALATRQMRTFSGMAAFTAPNGHDLARKIAERIRIFSYAVSLGKTRSLIFHIPTEELLASSFHLAGASAASYRAIAGDGVFRLSIGLEDSEDLIADLAEALA